MSRTAQVGSVHVHWLHNGTCKRIGRLCAYNLIRVHKMWCDLAGSVGTRTCDVFYLIEVLTWRGTFRWKTRLNRSSGSKVMCNWRVLGTIQNNRNSFLFFLAMSQNQCCRLLIDPARLQPKLYSKNMIFVLIQLRRVHSNSTLSGIRTKTDMCWKIFAV